MVLTLPWRFGVIVVVLTGTWGRNDEPDDIDDYDEWSEQTYMWATVNNLTKRFAEDTTMKLRLATVVQEPYREQVAYHLGTIMASIQDKFRMMLNLYRKYGNLTTFRQWDYGVEDAVNAYYLAKGYFSEIRMDIEIYYKVVAEHVAKRRSKRTQRRPFFKQVSNALVNIDDALNAIMSSTKAAEPERRRYGATKKALLKEVMKTKRKLFNRNKQEESYKRELRLRHWEQKWRNFVPEVEGVEINVPDIEPDSGRPKLGTI